MARVANFKRSGSRHSFRVSFHEPSGYYLEDERVSDEDKLPDAWTVPRACSGIESLLYSGSHIRWQVCCRNRVGGSESSVAENA